MIDLADIPSSEVFLCINTESVIQHSADFKVKTGVMEGFSLNFPVLIFFVENFPPLKTEYDNVLAYCDIEAYMCFPAES